MSIRGVSLLAVAACAALGLVGVSMASAAPPATTSFYLDSYTANNASGGNSVTGPNVLVAGQTYTLEVQGTYSAWGDWPYRRCGKPSPPRCTGRRHRMTTPSSRWATTRCSASLSRCTPGSARVTFQR